ncbi:MAG: EAL domain-containing protein [Novosphingobium sp.]|nr:EAL domain-containing protein [Novosphingobium sp.]
MPGQELRSKQQVDRAVNAARRDAGVHVGKGAARKPSFSSRATAPAQGESGAVLEAFSLIHRDWWLIAPAIVIAAIVLCVRTGELPGIASLISFFLAIVLSGLTPLFCKFDVKHWRLSWLRYVNMIAAIGLPMVLLGYGAASWYAELPAFLAYALISLVAVFGVLSIALLNGVVPAAMTANVGLWLGVWLVEGEAASLVAIVAGIILAAGLTARQRRRVIEERVRQIDLERIQRRAEELLAEYERMGHGWFWETDRRGAITYVSPQIGEALGCEPDVLVGRPFTELFILNAAGNEGERTLNFHLSARSSFNELAVRAATDGEERWWSVSGRPVHDQFNNYVGFRGSGTDLTEKRRSEEHATRLAHYDSLTGLANRFQMSVTLDKILSSRRIEQRACAVFLLDLDRFKQVNDTLGHPAGDALLKQVSQRLTRTVGDAGRVGRLGGDEFQVILPGVHQRDDLARLAHEIIENLSQPYSIEGHRVVIGASVGIALSPDDGQTSEAIVRNSDLALYAAKDSGRGRFYFYDDDLHSDAAERSQLEQDLRDALNSGMLELHYQPVVHTTTEKITGFEALMRWHHPKLGYLSPAKFIPIAEDAGLIGPIGEWALRTACNDLSRWPESVRVAVNVSPLQFANPALPAIVTNAIASAQVDPSRLELEITESVFLNDDKSTEAMFTALKGVGVRLALDDFGTGYSSLGYLKKAPFDKIKIDQSFVHGATMTGSRNGALIASIVNLAEALNMETTAEGVETLDELDLVRELGCSHVQGYIYEKALTPEAATQRLQDGLTAVASGPRSARPSRHKMLRKVVLEHGGEKYEGTIRNISNNGAMIEGLWNVPPSTIFSIQLSRGYRVTATSRWSRDDRMGVEFAVPLATDADGYISLVPPRDRGDSGSSILLRKAG